ncbi:MAG TPA: PTS sugar transporter subunit IIB [Bacillota bacterium]|nr:PTS sugar transporter subunit IIB [Bacillota bacterium]HQE02678.1 PTS sugar transporter subunit IIB [Bacillota bacterium]
MKIVTVCGLGVGSSLILKMTVESALSKLGKTAEVEHWDMGTVKGVNADLIVTTDDLRKYFENQDNVIFVENLVDVNEVYEKLKDYLERGEG